MHVRIICKIRAMLGRLREDSGKGCRKSMGCMFRTAGAGLPSDQGGAQDGMARALRKSDRMATTLKAAAHRFKQTLGNETLSGRIEALRTALPAQPVPVVPFPRSWGSASLAARQELAQSCAGRSLPAIRGELPPPDPESLRGSIEQQIGWVQVPLGLAGPLRVTGSGFSEDVCLPLATSEGALVASIHRGARALSDAGGVRSVCVASGIQRAPSFLFRDIYDALGFVAWVEAHAKELGAVFAPVSRHSVLREIRPNLDGNLVTLVLEFTTGDAAGQNMVTVCSDRICRFIVRECPVPVRRWFVEGNLSGDKRATSLAMQRVRGHKAVAEAVLTREVLARGLGTDRDLMMEYWKVAAVNGIHSGSVGVQGHFANPLAALFCACGQDIACVAEAAVGVTRFEERPDGALYVAVTLPCLVVGTVGGGTGLPTARESLSILGCAGEGKVVRFAEICAAAVLAGEVSMLAALSSGDFSRAHALFGRKVR